ncbi:uncharacterized protein ova [Periplaneta americana]|uniref:uncharacterized protein ova n=1 Tax=Periplaneta americana TaxID=6978 RepID=UPI0037E8BDB3
MSDESVLIGLVTLQVKKLKLGGYSVSDISNDAIMISNLPLLFADGYPTCLEKFTLRQLEKFVPFMLQCSLGQNYLDRYTTTPKWWPSDLPFSILVEKPEGMDDARWFAVLKSMVCRCYTYHGCEFMLRFCTELSECPSTSYVFADSWDGTTSLYNKETGRLMVTFRNENREYDTQVENSPRRSLLPKNSQSAPRIVVQPPLFDIYLCDGCDGEFDTLSEVQDHEKICGKRQMSLEEVAEEQQQQECQDSFLLYLKLKPVNLEETPKAKSPTKQAACKRRYPAGVTFTRCCGVPFSSPLGMVIQKKSRMATVNPQVLLDRMERYCVTKTVGASSRFRERELEERMQESIEWPITWKPPHHRKSQETWTHHYCFTQKERREKLARRLSGGLNSKSRDLLSRCRKCSVALNRLTEDEIRHYTMRAPSPESEGSFPLPTLLPNTMYSYNMSAANPQPIALSPQSTIPLIDLCSTDEEDEDDMEDVVPEPIVLEEDQVIQTGTVYCDKSGNPTSVTFYPVLHPSYDAFTRVGTDQSCVEGGRFVMSYSSDHSFRYSSIPRDWPTKVIFKSPPSPSPAPTLDGEEDITYSSTLNCNFTDISQNKLTHRKERGQSKMSSESEEMNGSEGEELSLMQYSEADPKLYKAYVSLSNSRIQPASKTPLVPSSTATSLNCNAESVAKACDTKLHTNFCCSQRKETGGSSTEFATSPSECDVENTSDNPKSRHRSEQNQTNVSVDELHQQQSQTDLLSVEENIPVVDNPVPHQSKSFYVDSFMSDQQSMPSVAQSNEHLQRKPLSNAFSASNLQCGSNGSDCEMNSNIIDSPTIFESKLPGSLRKEIICDSKLQGSLRKERHRSKTLAVTLPSSEPSCTHEESLSTYPPHYVDFRHERKSLSCRREKTRFATKRASKEPLVLEDVGAVNSDSKRPRLQLYSQDGLPLNPSPEAK